MTFKITLTQSFQVQEGKYKSSGLGSLLLLVGFVCSFSLKKTTTH